MIIGQFCFIWEDSLDSSFVTVVTFNGVTVTINLAAVLDT